MVKRVYGRIRDGIGLMYEDMYVKNALFTIGKGLGCDQCTFVSNDICHVPKEKKSLKRYPHNRLKKKKKRQM